MIRNPNDIVEKLVADYSGVLGERLISVILYGSAVSHEYRPGKSDVNIALVLTDTAIPVLHECSSLQARWMRRGVATPLYLTPAAIAASLDMFPVEFLNMKHAYRVLYGENFLAQVQIDKQDLRLQCRRELSGIVLHLKREFIRTCVNPRRLTRQLVLTTRALLPFFKALLVIYERKIPNSKAEIIASVEDLFGLGASVISEIFNGSRRRKTTVIARYDEFTRAVETFIDRIGRVHDAATGAQTGLHEVKQIFP